jgi:hypothetical protein
MFTSINFKSYADARKSFYDKLSSVKIDMTQISEPIRIDVAFLAKIETHFAYFLKRRGETVKFTGKENKEYKKLLIEHFPEMLPVFEHKGPSVYWFQIEYSDGLTNENVINQYLSIRKDKNKATGWWSRGKIQRKDIQTDVLYLGKVESQLQNRLISHVGLGHQFTSSLKLQKWMPELENMTLSFRFLKLDKEMKDYVEDIEKVLWDKYKPLLGAAPKIKTSGYSLEEN